MNSREHRKTLHGAGLGLRRDLLPEMFAAIEDGRMDGVSFLELAPENWMRLGGRFARDLNRISEVRPLACHGLSLNLGGTRPLDMQLLADVKAFMRTHQIALYTEHLSWCAHDGQLYDLLPLPATWETVRYVARRIRQVQDFLGERIGIENASFYVAPAGAEIDDASFVQAVVTEADCLFHLDVNNVYVNSQNHGFDAIDYLKRLPLEKTCYIHVAGHHVQDDGLIIDTHGMPVIDPVWALLRFSYERLALLGLDPRSIPSCLERDFNFPPLDALLDEVAIIHDMQQHVAEIRVVQNAPHKSSSCTVDRGAVEAAPGTADLEPTPSAASSDTRCTVDKVPHGSNAVVDEQVRPEARTAAQPDDRVRVSA